MLPENPIPIVVKILLLFLWIAEFCYLPFCYLFYRNRNMHPINARLPYVILASNLAIYFLDTNEIWVSLFDQYYPCAARKFFGFFPYPLLYTIWTYRFLHLLFVNKIATKNVATWKDHPHQITSSSTLEEWKANWFVKYRKFIHPRTAIYFLFVQINFLFLVSLSFVLLEINTSNDLRPCNMQDEIQQIWNTISTAILVSTVLLATIAGFMIRSLPGDAFWIRREFGVVIYLAMVVLAIYGLAAIFHPPRYFIAFFILVHHHCVMVAGTVWPYLLSRENHSGSSSDSQSGMLRTQLIDVLKNPAGFQIFLGYLQTEFSTENLLFWDTIEQLKKLDPEDLLIPQHIERIYFHYCQENAPCSVNIPFELRAVILQTLQELSDQPFSELKICEKEELLHIFDAAQQNVYELMNGDSWPRFQKSSQYQLLLAEPSKSKTESRESKPSSPSLEDRELEAIVR